MRRKIPFLAILPLSLGLLSCGSLPVYFANEVTDHYDFSVGVGETVFFSLSGWFHLDDFADLSAKVGGDFSAFEISSVEGDKEGCLRFATVGIVDCQLTCLKAFEGEIDISRITFSNGSLLITSPLDFKVSFNAAYATSNAAFAPSYRSMWDVHGVLPSGNCLFYQGDNIYYYIVRPYCDGYDKHAEIVLDGLSSFDPGYLSVDAVGCCYIPDGAYDIDCFLLDYAPFEPPVEVYDGVSDCGLAIRIQTSVKDRYGCCGTDLSLRFTANGDDLSFLREIVYA